MTTDKKRKGKKSFTRFFCHSQSLIRFYKIGGEEYKKVQAFIYIFTCFSKAQMKYKLGAVFPFPRIYSIFTLPMAHFVFLPSYFVYQTKTFLLPFLPLQWRRRRKEAEKKKFFFVFSGKLHGKEWRGKKLVLSIENLIKIPFFKKLLFCSIFRKGKVKSSTPSPPELTGAKNGQKRIFQSSSNPLFPSKKSHFPSSPRKKKHQRHRSCFQKRQVLLRKGGK